MFLDGMLVTTDTPPRYEVIWPLPDDPGQLERIKDNLREGFGLGDPDELRKKLDIPVEEMTRYHGYLLDRMIRDYPTALQVWKHVLQQDADDLHAAVRIALLGMYLNGPQATLKDIARSSGRTAQQRAARSDDLWSPAYLEALRCTLLLQARRPAEALAACNVAAELDGGRAPLQTAGALLALGKSKEALVEARQVAQTPIGARSANVLFVLGLTQQSNGLDAEARATWSVAQSLWPEDERLTKALAGVRKSVFLWIDDSMAIANPAMAEELALCGHFYTELGMESRAKECYAQSRRFHPVPALAHQLVFLGQTNLDRALSRTETAVNRNPDPNLLSALGWMHLRRKHFGDAKKSIERALELAPNDAKAMSLMWQVCGELHDYPCVIEYRKRLGLPTHFNVQQYQDVSKAWQEQARRNGEDLAARDLDSASVPRPPAIREIVVTPLGVREPPEFAGLTRSLSARFSGIKIRSGPREDLPPGVYRAGRRQVMWEDLLERLREEPGRIYVVEQDLGLYDANFAYAQVDHARGRAVVSLSRLRSLVGDPTDATTTLGGAVLTAVSHRLQSEMLSVIAKLVGVSFPCSVVTCVMRERRAVTDLVTHEPAFCEAHQKELEAALSRLEATR